MNTRTESPQDAFLYASTSVLQQVFGVTVTRKRRSQDLRAVAGKMIAVASLTFSGDNTGRLWMLLEEEQIQPLVEHLMARYALRTPVVAREVFAEMLNVYTAQLVTALSRSGLTHVISPPDLDFPPCVEGPRDLEFTVFMKTKESFAFAFHYIYEPPDTKELPACSH